MSALEIRRATEQPRPTDGGAFSGDMMLSAIKSSLAALPKTDALRIHLTAHIDADACRVIGFDPDCRYCQDYIKKED